MGAVLTEGIPQIAHYIHAGLEMVKVVSDVNNAMGDVHFNAGLNTGFKYAAHGQISYETCPERRPNADEELDQAVKNFDDLTFSFVDVLKNMVDHTESGVMAEIKKLTVPPA